MECPVCQSSAIDDTLKVCPDCQSDLEAYKLTNKIGKTSRNRMTFGIIASILFLAMLVIWIFKDVSAKAEGDIEKPDLTESSVNLQSELENIKSENQLIAEENKKLKEKITQLEQKNVKREKEYIVQDGESLYSIARKVYGNGYRYEDLAKDNNIEDPNNLQAGQKLIIYY